MRLFIAEKPSVATAIADALGTPARKHPGYTECGDNIITWCFGHMLQLVDPEDINPAWGKWVREDLPINLWPPRYKPKPESQAQLAVIVGLIKRASHIVHAGDPDDEGQLLVEEVLQWAGLTAPVTAPVSRVLINDLTRESVKKALDNLRPNAGFQPLYQRALVRSVGDQMFGFNMTRACTLAARAQSPDFRGVLSVGRVPVELREPLAFDVVREPASFSRVFNLHPFESLRRCGRDLRPADLR